MEITVRKYKREDVRGILKCLVYLRSFEHSLDPERLKKLESATEYLSELLVACHRHGGAIYVAEKDQEVVMGMIAIKIRNIDKGKSSYSQFGMLSDLVILPDYVDQGVAKKLINEVEIYLLSKNINVVKTSILYNYTDNIHHYLRNGFNECEVVLKKKLKND